MFFIFDWDGTLSDSASKIVSCMQAASEDLDLAPLSVESVKNIIGLGLSEAIQMLYPGIDKATEASLCNAYSKHFIERDQVPSDFFPGVMQTLNSLQERDFKLAVATGKSRRGLDRVLSNLELNAFFHHSRCADETASKPNPQMLDELLQEAGVPVEEAVMIGDTEWDMVMADNMGMRKIAVSYGAHTRERLDQFKPDMMIDRFDEILDWTF